MYGSKAAQRSVVWLEGLTFPAMFTAYPYDDVLDAAASDVYVGRACKGLLAFSLHDLGEFRDKYRSVSRLSPRIKPFVTHTGIWTHSPASPWRLTYSFTDIESFVEPVMQSKRKPARM